MGQDREPIPRGSDAVRLVALELGNTLEVGAAGGDRLLPAMVAHSLGVSVVVLTTRQGAARWRKVTGPVTVVAAPDALSNTPRTAAAVFLEYRNRAIWADGELGRRLKPGDVLYSSTEVFPDVRPAAKRAHRASWIARVHHAVAAPRVRTGSPLVNAASWVLQRRLIASMRQRATVTLALNPPIARWLSGLGFPQKKISVLGAGVNLEAPERFPAGPNTPRFDAIYLGRLHRTKGVFDLPAIWAAVRRVRPGARLGIIGDGSALDLNKLRHAFEGTGVSGAVELLGFLPDPERWRALNAAKIFLFTDHEAGFGLALLEAFACGLPVVAYDLPYLPEVFAGGMRRVPLGEPEAFGRAVAGLLADDRERTVLGRAAKREAARHSWQAVVAAFHDILARIPNLGT